MGDGSNIGPTALQMENSETVDVILVDSYLQSIMQDTDKRLGKGLYSKQEQSEI